MPGFQAFFVPVGIVPASESSGPLLIRGPLRAALLHGTR
jgi:hypothetical protein